MSRRPYSDRRTRTSSLDLNQITTDGDVATLSTANLYTDASIQSAIDHLASDDVATLSTANAYTDENVAALENYTNTLAASTAIRSSR